MSGQRPMVKSRAALAATMLWLVGAAGCAPDNVTACREDFVARVNNEYDQCGQEARYDPDEICPDRLNDGEDCTGYFECLGDGYECDDATGNVTWETDNCDCG